MPVKSLSRNLIEEAISKRCQRRGLSADITKIRYLNSCLFHSINTSGKHILYVGLGHGIDALLALLEDDFSHITGVDPYIGEHGNDLNDYSELLALTKEYNIEEKFKIEKTTIQQYIKSTSKKFDIIICNDVLHHIFWTKDILTKSEYLDESHELFKSLKTICSNNTRLIISEPERSGVRQTLTRLGVLKGCVDYSTKQPRREWIAAAKEGGWQLCDNKNYVPWALKKISSIFSGMLGRYTACDKYILTFTNNIK